MHWMIRTEDGSSTLYVPELDEHYHSVHGAVREARQGWMRNWQSVRKGNFGLLKQDSEQA